MAKIGGVTISTKYLQELSFTDLISLKAYLQEKNNEYLDEVVAQNVAQSTDRRAIARMKKVLDSRLIKIHAIDSELMAREANIYYG